MNQQPIDVPTEVNPQAVAVREEQAQELALAPKEAITPAQAKVDAIANLTMSAYQRAATLNLTPEESAALQADFPDEAFQTGAAGKEHLIYIEHAWLRDRFNSVFGMGQWAIVPRNRWAESFRTFKGTEGSRVYVEAMLVVRGCFVGEAIGAMEYYPKNESQNYGDAVEGAKTAAFRRCAKEFGVGLQAWKKEWCEGWWQRRKGSKPWQRPAASTAQSTPRDSNPTKEKLPADAPTPSRGVSAQKNGNVKDTSEQHLLKLKARMLEALTPERDIAESFFRTVDWLMPLETLESLELRYVPQTKEEFDALIECIHGSEPVLPYKPHTEQVAEKPKVQTREEQPPQVDDPDADDAPWRSFPVPFGKHAGVSLAELDKKTLFGFWANFEVELEFKGKARSKEQITRDRTFRQMLDAAGEHYEFTKPEDKQ